jgi:dephospho-CoA kinase
MKLVFIYGMPASGKLTVAKELSALTGYHVFHNHLVVDVLLEIFDFGSKSFVELRERFWLEVFREASSSGAAGLIFTFAPEKTVRREFIENVVSQAANDELVFVELYCADNEIEKRLTAEGRKNYKKLDSVELLRELVRTKTFDSPKMPDPQLRIDTGKHSAKESAVIIARHLGVAN